MPALKRRWLLQSKALSGLKANSPSALRFIRKSYLIFSSFPVEVISKPFCAKASLPLSLNV